MEIDGPASADLELNEALRAGDSSLTVGCSPPLSSVHTGVTIPPIGHSFIDRRCSHDPVTPADARGHAVAWPVRAHSGNLPCRGPATGHPLPPVPRPAQRGASTPVFPLP